MIKSLNSDIGKRINVFDNYEVQSVETFNQLFSECPIKDREPDTLVIIGLPDTGNTRKILVGDNLIKHKMFSDTLYGMDRSEFLSDERDKELDDIMGHPV